MKDYELRDLLTRIARRALDAELNVGIDSKALQRNMNDLFEDVEKVMDTVFIEKSPMRVTAYDRGVRDGLSRAQTKPGDGDMGG